MKRIIMLALLFVFYLPLAGRAQICDEGQSLGVIRGIQTVLTDQGSSTISNHEVFGFRLSNGQIMYVINVGSIEFVGGDPTVVDSKSTAEIFNALAKSTIRKGVALGYYGQCPSDCYVVMTQVRQSCCVNRLYNGLGTKFEPCEFSQCCTMDYTFCCPDGSLEPDVRLVGASGGPCSGETCEGTCPPPDDLP